MHSITTNAVNSHIRELHDEASNRRLEATVREMGTGRRSIVAMIVGAIRGVFATDGTPVLPPLTNYPFRG
jgi:hypothetical protein